MLTFSKLPGDRLENHPNKKVRLTCEYLLEPIVTADFSNSNFDGYLSDELKQIFIQHTNLKTLILANNRIDDNSILDLIEVLKENSCLTELDLSSNQIGSNGATYLLEAMCENQKTTLRKLDLSDNCIDSIEENVIRKFLKNNRSIKILILNQNALNTPSKNGHTLPLLFESLVDNQTLNYLSLQNTNLNDKHINTLISGLNNNISLQTLNLSQTVIHLDPQKIIHLILSLNDKKNFTFIFGGISNHLANLIVQTIPKKHLKIIAECPDPILTKKLSLYHESSIIPFSCLTNKIQENNPINYTHLSVQNASTKK